MIEFKLLYKLDLDWVFPSPHLNDGFVREVMCDGIDRHQCSMNGWQACRSDGPDVRLAHLRTMGSSQQGGHVGRMRHGYARRLWRSYQRRPLLLGERRAIAE